MLNEIGSTGIRASQLTGIERTLADAFDAAGVNYVFLHGDSVGESTESDIDIAVDRQGVKTIDALLRMGHVGRLVQAFHYDVPWCWGYVIEEAPSRQRLLDVVCDPWAISRYGLATGVALASATRTQGLRVPSAPATVLYLAVKRSFKGAQPSDKARLLEMFERDPDGATRLLDEALGVAGRSLAVALSSGSNDFTRELASVRAVAEAAARTPTRLTLRAVFEGVRTVRRLVRPSGLVVCLAGPDGVGKSTIAERLANTKQQAFARVVRLHGGGPLLLPRPGRLVRHQLDATSPHGRSRSGRFVSALRLSYLWGDATLGWWPKVFVPQVRRSLVLIERGLVDLSIDPQRYRLALAESTIRRFVSLVPRPDLIVLLNAPARKIHSQKRELTVSEIDRQLTKWKSIAVQHPDRFVMVDASQSPEAVTSEVFKTVVNLQSARQRDLSSARHAVKCLGRVSVQGKPYSLVRQGGRVRWILPDKRLARGPWRSGLYRPATSKHALRAFGLELGRGLLPTRISRQVRVDVTDGLAPLLADLLGTDRVELAAALTSDADRGDRALLSVLDGGIVQAFVKVAGNQMGLEREEAILAAVRTAAPASFNVPETLSFFNWRDCAVLVLRPITAKGFADRSLGERELAAAIEIASLGTALEQVLGREPGCVPMHGDFAPWNCARSARGLLLWDWEAARLGLPLEDLFHWRVQRLVLFGRGTPEMLAASAAEPDRQVCAACDRLGLPHEAGLVGLRAYLERSLKLLGAGDSRDRAVLIRRRILECLDSRTFLSRGSSARERGSL